MADDQLSGSFVDQLAEEFLERHRRGERPTVAEYLDGHPDYADEIRDVLPALLMLESLADRGKPGSKFSFLSGVRQPETLGDYRILQEVGQGGMGIVYEAEQISLGRHVALKVLPFQLAGNEKAIERFQREARAAANLQHPNIVPVYDVGEEDSVWYYAMQFVHGQSLSDVLNEIRDIRSKEAGQMFGKGGQATDLAITLIEGDATGIEEQQRATSEDEADQLKERLLRTVMDDFIAQRDQGGALTEEELIRQHPELMPELQEELELARLVQASRLPSIVEDLTELESRWSADGDADVAKNGEPPEKESVTESTAAASSVVSLTGEFELHSTAARRHYFQSVAQIGVHISQAVAYAHEQGVVHRDIKPSNLLLDTTGRVWVTDFGLAKLERGHGESSGGFVGTPRYMSPEQIHGKSDERSDVYGLGVTLYELFTLQPAFAGSNYFDAIHQICHEGPPSLRSVDASIPKDLETIVLKAMSREPAARYQTAGELAADLQRFIANRPIAARRSGKGAHVVKWLQRNPWTVVASLCALCLAGALVLRPPADRPGPGHAPSNPNASRLSSAAAASAAVSMGAPSSWWMSGAQMAEGHAWFTLSEGEMNSEAFASD